MTAPPEISVIVPLYNEVENVRPLVHNILEALPSSVFNMELILVDDGSVDKTWEEIQIAQASHPQVRGIRHPVNLGQSAAFLSGFRSSKAKVLATLDGDLQNDPADLPMMLRELEQADMVCGVRRARSDTTLRLLSSRVARWARKLVLRIDFADTGCSLRVFKSWVWTAFPPFKGVHRFMPIFAQNAGAVVKEIPVQHHPRVAGRSKYGIGNRLVCGVLDLVMVALFLRRQIPLRDNSMEPGSTVAKDDAIASSKFPSSLARKA